MTEAAGEKLKQQKFPGMKPKHIEEIEDKAEEVKEFETSRLEAQERETKARKELTELMKKHKIRNYDLDEDREVVLVVRRKKKAKAAKSDK